jgi:hypothetical protein
MEIRSKRNLGTSYRLLAKVCLSALAEVHSRSTDDRFRCIAVLIIVKIECLLLGHKLKYADVRFAVESRHQVFGTCHFSRSEARHKGLAKNTAQLMTLFALSDAWMARRHLLGARR